VASYLKLEWSQEKRLSVPNSEPTMKDSPLGENLPSIELFMVYFSKEYIPYSWNFLINYLDLMFQRHIMPPSLPDMKISSILGCAAITKE